MDEDQIKKELEPLGSCIVCPHDMLESLVIKERPMAIVVNTDKSGTIGEHWVAVYLMQDSKGEYFDSFGLPPLHLDVLEFLNTKCPMGWCYSNVTLQEYEDTICGNLCVCFHRYRLGGISYISFLKNMIKSSKRMLGYDRVKEVRL